MSGRWTERRAEEASSWAVGLAIVVAVALTRLHSYLLFHSLAEIFSIVVACATFMLFWNARRFVDNGAFLVLGIALLPIGVVDLLHALAYEGMGVFPGSDANLPTQLWVAARLLQGGAFLAAALCVQRVPRAGIVLAAIAGVTACLLASIFSWGVFPDCYLLGTGLTPFKVGAEYTICLVLLAAAVLLWRQRGRFDPHVLRLVISSVAATIAAELAFTLYRGVYDAANMAGHLLKFLSFFLIYKAMIEVSLRHPYELIFRELKRSEEALRRSEERLRTLATIGQIAASIVHDVRSPLAAMRYALAILKRKIGDRDPECTDYLDKIDAQIESTNRIISNVMELAHSKHSEKQPVDLGKLLEEVVGRHAAESEAIVEVRMEPSPMTVLADRVQLGQVLGNLVSNAAEATEGRGRIRVLARREDDCDVIDVQDDGPGVPAEIRDEIFEPLVSAKPQGTGLGLAICRQIIQRHGGTIELCDTGAGGATFRIRLPRQESA